MLRSLEIEGFRGFRKVTVPLHALTAVVGRNSSGKSSLLQAVRMASAALELALTSPTTVSVKGAGIVVCTGMVVSDPSRLCALSDWQQLFTHEIAPGKTSLAIDLVFDPTDAIRKLSVKLLSGRNAQLLLDVVVQSPTIAAKANGFPAKSKRRTKILRDELLRERPIALFVPAFYGVTPREEHRSLPLVNRSLGSGDQSHIVRNLVARLDGSTLNRLNGMLGRTLGAQLLTRTAQSDAENTETLSVTFKDTNGELELSAAGTGLVALVALFATLESVRAQKLARSTDMVPIVLLDEPEAHLHPRLQGSVGEELADLARDFGFQLVLATHSIEMINRLGRARATLLSVDRAQNTVVELSDESATVQALEDFADLEPFTALNMLASRRILFHEGPSDYLYLDACARLYFRSDDARMAEWNRYVPCSLDGSGNAGAAAALRLALSSKLFPKLKGDPVRAALVLDRDYTRTPKVALRAEAGGAIGVVECVWSRHSIESLFLDAPILAGWLATASGADEGDLAHALVKAIARVDTDKDLEDRAVDGRTDFHRRPEQDHRMLDAKTAVKRAREEVRAAPETFHHGRDRSKRILSELRSLLLPDEKRKLRGSLLDLVTKADSNKLGDAQVLVPADIRKLLDLLVPRAHGLGHPLPSAKPASQTVSSIGLR
jgi:hypothetical protein